MYTCVYIYIYIYVLDSPNVLSQVKRLSLAFVGSGGWGSRGQPRIMVVARART